MNKRKGFKWQWLATLGISLCAVFGFSLFHNVKAAALGETVLPIQLFEGNSNLQETIVNDRKGLKVNTNENTATLNGVISGDFEMEYTNGTVNWGAYEFAFYDKDEPEKKVFSIVRDWCIGNYGIVALVDYTQETPIITMQGTTSVSFSGMVNWDAYQTLATAEQEIYPNWIENAGVNTVGKIQLIWDENDVCVTASAGKNGVVDKQITVGSIHVENFSDGYFVKIGKDTNLNALGSVAGRLTGNTDVVLLSVNGIDLGGEEFQVALKNKSISHENEYVKDGKNVMDCIQGEALEFMLNGEFKKNGILFSVPYQSFVADIDTSVFVGEKEVVIEKGASQKKYVLNVTPGYAVKDSFTDESNAEFVTVKQQRGVKVIPQNAPTTFNGLFHGNLSLEYIYGESCYGGVKFEFFDKDDLARPVFSVYRTYGTQIEGDDTLYVIWGSASLAYNGKYYAMNNAYDSHIQASKACQLAGKNFYPVNNCASSVVNPARADKWAEKGALTLAWSGNQVTVQASVGDTNENSAQVTGMETLATLTLDNFSDGYVVKISDADEVLVGSDKNCADSIVVLSVNGKEFNRQYCAYDFYADEISYEPYEDYQEGEPIYVAKNGKLRGNVKTLKNTFGYANGWIKETVGYNSIIEKGLEMEFDADFSSVGEKSVTVKTKLFGCVGAEKIYPLIVEESAKITFETNGGSAVDNVYYSANDWSFVLPVPVKENWKFGGWYIGSDLFQGFTQSPERENITLTAHWYDDVSPEIALVDESKAITQISTEMLAFDISANDVIAYDRATAHNFASEEIEIRIKAPNSNEYETYSSFTLNKKMYGAYIVRYIVTDNWTAVGNIENVALHTQNNVAYVERVIYYALEKPVLNVNEAVVSSGVVGKEIVLPTATAVWEERNLTVNITVSLRNEQGESKEVKLDGGKFVPEESGVYTVVYYTQDDCGQIVYTEYEINVKNDTTAPVITVDFNVTELNVGDTLTIPTAVVTDDVDNTPKVSISVYYQGAFMSNEAVKVTHAGVYTVVYTAMDEAGNVQVLQFDVLAKAQVEKGGCNSTIAPLSISFVLTIGLTAVVICVIRKKRKIN